MPQSLQRRLRELSNILSKDPPLKIHFIEMPAWEPQIRRGFQGAKHTLSFGPLNKQIAENSDLVVPLDMLGVLQADKFRSNLRHQIIPIPEKTVALLCDDKLRFNRRVEEIGHGNLIPKVGLPLKFPFILKKRISAASTDTFRINNEQEKSSFEQQIDSTDFYCQLMVPGKTEYAAHLLIKNNKIIFDLTMKYTFEHDYSVKAKHPSKTTIVQSRHIQLFEKLLNDISFSGLCCLNYKEIRGVPMILEINPRLGGSLCAYFPGVLSAAFKAKSLSQSLSRPPRSKAIGKGTA
jgi:hypothetical protein